MSITDWPAAERPREKLLQQGAAALSDAELLAIFLRTGVRGKSAVDLARELLSSFNGLKALLETEHKKFCQAQGLGDAKYAQLQAVLEMSRRYLQSGGQRGNVMSNPQLVKDYLSLRLKHYSREVFACLFLDAKNRIISCHELFFGTINAATVHPRVVVVQALTENAAAVIFAHNHPSGVAEPSESDKQITQQLKDVLGILDIRVLDHIIIGDQNTFSFAEHKLL